MNVTRGFGPVVVSAAPLRAWRTARHLIDLSRPRVMGIVNVTPDSFSDGGRFLDAGAAMAHCDRLVDEGADILDIGGESTRPGAVAPDHAVEAARVLPVLRHAVTLGIPVSVDTSQTALMQMALDEGVDIVNDVRALRRPGALDCLAAHPSAGVCLMHLPDEPATMQSAAHYGDVVADVAAWLCARSLAVQDAGIRADRIVLDPGIGFGKTAAHNLSLLSRQDDLVARLSAPVLVGWSRKSTLGTLGGGRRPSDRVAASVAAALLAVQRGAAVVRVHDVAATVQALAVLRAAPTIAHNASPAV